MKSKMKGSQSLRILGDINETSSMNSTQSGVKSGGDISPIYLGIVDKYGELVTTDSSSKLQVQIDLAFKNNTNSTTYAPNVAGSTSFYA
jgi:hypothetical protein